MIFLVASTAPAFAVTVTLPCFLAFTTPKAFTSAISSLLDSQEISALSILCPYWSLTTAVNSISLVSYKLSSPLIVISAGSSFPTFTSTFFWASPYFKVIVV